MGRGALPRHRVERFRRDPFARRMGFELLHAEPGYAKVAVDLTEDLFNFAGTPHGGLLFSLADYAFAVASNSHGRIALATHGSIQFMAAAEAGERLYAEAKESHLTRRAGFYDMTVTTESGRLVARCLGVVHRTSRALDEEGSQ
jgi:acyl-CoA thioesterase